MKAQVNGEPHEFPGALTVAALLELLGSPATGIAVARNDRVVPRSDYATADVCDGDRIEIIVAVAGG